MGNGRLGTYFLGDFSSSFHFLLINFAVLFYNLFVILMFPHKGLMTSTSLSRSCYSGLKPYFSFTNYILFTIITTGNNMCAGTIVAKYKCSVE